MTNDLQLLSKTDVIREYRFPKAQLDKDIATGAIKHFWSTPLANGEGYGRCYIPRRAVEQRIAELAGLPAREGE